MGSRQRLDWEAGLDALTPRRTPAAQGAHGGAGHYRIACPCGAVLAECSCDAPRVASVVTCARCLRARGLSQQSRLSP